VEWKVEKARLLRSSPARHPQKAAVQKYFQKSENSLASLWDFS